MDPDAIDPAVAAERDRMVATRRHLAERIEAAPHEQELVAALEKQPELLYLRHDITTLTALRDLLLGGKIDIDVVDLTRLLAVVTQAKALTVRTMGIEGHTVVPIENVQQVAGIVIDIYQCYVPPDQHAAVLEELRLRTRYDQPIPPSGMYA